MTHIAHFATKREFKAAVSAGKRVVCVDPSVIEPRDFTINGENKDLAAADFTVTNHPKRSWYAHVMLINGKWWIT